MPGVCQGAPEPTAGLGRGPVAPGVTGRVCLCGSPETVNWGAVSTGPGLGSSLPTCPRAPWLPRREKQGKGSCLLLPWNLSRSGVEQPPEALAGLRPQSRAAPLSRSDPVRRLSPWPSITLLGPFAPCWAGLIACAPREVARVSQATLKARSLYQFLIRGLCLGGHDITLQKVLSAVKRTCQPVCRAAGAAGLQVQLDPGVSPLHTLSPFLSFTSHSLAPLSGCVWPRWPPGLKSQSRGKKPSSLSPGSSRESHWLH